MSARTRQICLCLLLPLLACGRIEPVDTDAADDSPTDPPRDGRPEANMDAPPDAIPDAADDPVIEFEGDCPPVRIAFEAEDMTLDGSFTVASNSTDTVGEYIYADDSTAEASIAIGIPCTDRYVLWGLVRWESPDTDSYYWSMDGASPRVWDFLQCRGREAGWHWDQVTGRRDSSYCDPPAADPEIFLLAEGDHTFQLAPREFKAIIAEFVLTNDLGYTPTPP